MEIYKHKSLSIGIQRFPVVSKLASARNLVISDVIPYFYCLTIVAFVRLSQI